MRDSKTFSANNINGIGDQTTTTQTRSIFSFVKTVPSHTNTTKILTSRLGAACTEAQMVPIYIVPLPNKLISKNFIKVNDNKENFFLKYILS